MDYNLLLAQIVKLNPGEKIWPDKWQEWVIYLCIAFFLFVAVLGAYRYMQDNDRRNK